jgi:hypothetical protein
MPRSALRHTDFYSSNEEVFPPQAIAFSCRNLPYPTISNRAALHPRMVRHKPDSIATMRSRLIAALGPLLPNCPTCARKPRKAFLLSRRL